MIYDLAVVGGGITGLVAAYSASIKGKKVLLLEKGPAFGGNIKTFRGNGYIFEEGPQTILANNRAVFELLESLNLEPQEASPGSRKRYIYKNGKLVPIPLKPQEFFKTPLVGWKTKLKLPLELFKKPREGDFSVARFVREHFGEEFLKYFVQPFVSGIYAGDAEKLSLRYAFPKLYGLQKKHGSLLKAFLKSGKVAPEGKLISFRGGLKTLADTLAGKIREKLLSSPVISIEKRGGRYRIFTPDGFFETAAVALTVPAYEMVSLFPELSLLKKIEYPPLAVVSLAFENVSPEGFGFLVPKGENLDILGAIFVSSLFPDRCPKGQGCFSVFMCGSTRREICSLPQEGILNRAVKGLKGALKIDGEPTFKRVRLWRRSIPQYNVGYGEIYGTVEEFERKNKGLFILSNFVGGSSLAKCIEKGWNFGQNL
jgi:oxygen-dependent protoporphyrinogen oxidase